MAPLSFLLLVVGVLSLFFFFSFLARGLTILLIFVSFNFYKCSTLGFLKGVHACTMTQEYKEDDTVSPSLHPTLGC